MIRITRHRCSYVEEAHTRGSYPDDGGKRRANDGLLHWQDSLITKAIADQAAVQSACSIQRRKVSIDTQWHTRAADAQKFEPIKYYLTVIE